MSDRPETRPGGARRPDARRIRSAAARLYAVQALFQMEAAAQSADKVRREFEDFRIGAVSEDESLADANEELFARILDDAVTWQGRIDQMTDRALVARWPLGRIDPVLRAVFRAGGAELIAAKAPPRVVISEYVAVAEAFFPEGRELRLVNAVLDHMAREANPGAFA